MRIIIEISEIEMAKAAAKPQVSIGVAPPEEAETPVSAVPPPELLQVAASLGAESAGSAPAVFMDADITEDTSLQPFEDIAEEGVDSEDAGSAPGTMPEAKLHDEEE